jgi:hypothetical protein
VVVDSAPRGMAEVESQHQIGVVDLFEMEAGTEVHQVEEIADLKQSTVHHPEVDIVVKVVTQTQAVGEEQREAVAGEIAPAKGM